jgi:predicted cobalt transporter CbtA
MKIKVGAGMVMKTYAYAHKNGGREAASMILAQAVATIICAVGFLAAFAFTGAQAQHGQTAITCTNPYSGASWQINVDYDHSTVDSSPAQISDESIAWKAENGWSYTLDRKSGKLTVVLSSATGGNFLHDQCKLDK